MGCTFLLVSISYSSVSSRIDEAFVYETSESKICSLKYTFYLQNLKNDSMSSDINIQQCPVMLLRNDSHQTLLNVLGFVAGFFLGGGEGCWHFMFVFLLKQSTL